MKRKPTDQRRKHLEAGNEAFIPPSRLRAIRWEEAVVRSRARREGRGDAVRMGHFTCHCGNINCVGNAYDRSHVARPGPAEVERLIVFSAGEPELTSGESTKLQGLYRRWKGALVRRVLEIHALSAEGRPLVPDALTVARCTSIRDRLLRCGVPGESVRVEDLWPSHQEAAPGVVVRLV